MATWSVDRTVQRLWRLLPSSCAGVSLDRPDCRGCGCCLDSDRMAHGSLGQGSRRTEFAADLLTIGLVFARPLVGLLVVRFFFPFPDSTLYQDADTNFYALFRCAGCLLDFAGWISRPRSPVARYSAVRVSRLRRVWCVDRPLLRAVCGPRQGRCNQLRGTFRRLYQWCLRGNHGRHAAVRVAAQRCQVSGSSPRNLVFSGCLMILFLARRFPGFHVKVE